MNALLIISEPIAHTRKITVYIFLFLVHFRFEKSDVSHQRIKVNLTLLSSVCHLHITKTNVGLNSSG